MTEKLITAKIEAFLEFDGCLTGPVIDMIFTDGKTARKIQFITNALYIENDIETARDIMRNYKPGDKIQLIKSGSGKYAGYRIPV